MYIMIHAFHFTTLPPHVRPPLTPGGTNEGVQEYLDDRVHTVLTQRGTNVRRRTRTQYLAKQSFDAILNHTSPKNLSC